MASNDPAPPTGAAERDMATLLATAKCELKKYSAPSTHPWIDQVMDCLEGSLRALAQEAPR